MSVSPDTIEQTISRLQFDDHGLIPAIAQEASSGDVLMLAWMNTDAVRETLVSKRVTYFSRSRQSLWRKGETSGHVQTLVDFRYDCDADAVLLTVEQTGPACHTNRHSCFYHHVETGGIRVDAVPAV